MKTKAFLDLLENNPEKELVFEYQSNVFVPNAYHITEIKNVHIESVDCGGNPHDFDQTVVQLWVDGVETKAQCMTAAKAKKIFDIVDNVKPLEINSPIFFEWGNKGLATSVYDIHEIAEDNEKIVVKLFVPSVQCKPKTLAIAGELIGKNLGACTPGSGCC